MSKYSVIKADLKGLISQSRIVKANHKEAQRALSRYEYERATTSPRPAYDYSYGQAALSAFYSKVNSSHFLRHFHLAYGLLRGRTMEQMESKVALGNEPDMSFVEDLKKEMEGKLIVKEVTGEAVHVTA